MVQLQNVRDLDSTDHQHRQQQQVLGHQVENKVEVVALADALAQPGAVMIELLDAVVAVVAVGGSGRTEGLASAVTLHVEQNL